MTKGFEDLSITWTGTRLYIYEQDGSGAEYLAGSPEEVAEIVKHYIEEMEYEVC